MFTHLKIKSFSFVFTGSFCGILSGGWLSEELLTAGMDRDEVNDIVRTSEFDIVLTVDGKHDSLGTKEGGWEYLAEVKNHGTVRSVRAWSSRILLSQCISIIHFFMFQLRDSN